VAVYLLGFFVSRIERRRIKWLRIERFLKHLQVVGQQFYAFPHFGSVKNRNLHISE